VRCSGYRFLDEIKQPQKNPSGHLLSFFQEGHITYPILNYYIIHFLFLSHNSSFQDNLVSSYHIQTYSPHRRSPVTRSSSYAGSINGNGNGNETPKRTPPKAMSTTEELLFEDTFRNTLSSLKRMLLEYHSHQEFLSSPSGRKEERSQELINEEIRRTITKMQNLQQTNYSESYKIAAYSLIAAQLLDELDEALAQQVGRSLSCSSYFWMTICRSIECCGFLGEVERRT
jgi:hypothetical protein